MYVFETRNGQFSKKRRRYVLGGGITDWISKIIPFFSTVGKAVIANKDTIKNVGDVVGSVATMASAVKQIVDIVKAKKAGASKQTVAPPTGKGAQQKEH